MSTTSTTDYYLTAKRKPSDKNVTARLPPCTSALTCPPPSPTITTPTSAVRLGLPFGVIELDCVGLRLGTDTGVDVQDQMSYVLTK